MNIRPTALLLAFTLVATIGCTTAPKNPPVTEPKLLSVRKIWDGAPHNAFTSLTRLNDTWYCAFRESSAHVPGTNGQIRVLKSADGDTWASAAVITEKGIDLRDPMITTTPDNRLMLLLGGSIYSGKDGDKKRTRTGARSRVAFSTDGAAWSAPTPVALENLWLWRVTWHGKSAYGAAYSMTNPRELSLWRTENGVAYTKVADPKPPCSPSETTIRFLPDDTMVMIVRAEPGSLNAVIGTSRAPYTEWTWHDAGRPIQGPDFIALPDSRMYYAGRDYTPDKKPHTAFGQLTPTSATPLLTLPSAGDNSYPGLALANPGEILMTYYASHEGKAAIYAARIAIPPSTK
jgi:hypothetical protein